MDTIKTQDLAQAIELLRSRHLFLECMYAARMEIGKAEIGCRIEEIEVAIKIISRLHDELETGGN